MKIQSDHELPDDVRIHQIDYWVNSANHDLDVAETLFKNGKYDWRRFSVKIL